MKIICVRESGRPVELSKLDEFDKEFKEKYDIIIAEYGQDMQVVHEKLKLLDIELAAKYDTLIKIDYPKTNKAILAFEAEYGAYMISVHTDNGKPVMIIMDMAR